MSEGNTDIVAVMSYDCSRSRCCGSKLSKGKTKEQQKVEKRQ